MVLGGETTNVGADFYEGGNFQEQSTSRRGVFTMFTSTISTVTNSGNLDTGALKLQLFAEGQRQGQHPGRQITETIVLQGAPTQLGGTPPPANPIGGQPVPGRPVIQAFGSVSAATPMWADRIGHQWTLVNNVLTIH
jgi:hypothetical protein